MLRALAPYLADRPRAVRALMAHVLTDEAFALTIAHFRRIRQADMPGFWWAAIVTVFIPWNSGLQPWALAILITAGTCMSVLINARWCERRGSVGSKILAILREVIWSKKQQRSGND